jgi:hypothetical protein
MDYEEELDTAMWRSGVRGTQTVDDRRQALCVIHDAAERPRRGTWVLPWDAQDDATGLGEHVAVYMCGAALECMLPRRAGGLEWRGAGFSYALTRRGARWALDVRRWTPPRAHPDY